MINFIYFFMFLRLAFYLATLVSVAIILTDREAGIWKRSLVQGNQLWKNVKQKQIKKQLYN